jgi:hypothetical protein
VHLTSGRPYLTPGTRLCFLCGLKRRVDGARNAIINDEVAHVRIRVEVIDMRISTFRLLVYASCKGY